MPLFRRKPIKKKLEEDEIVEAVEGEEEEEEEYPLGVEEVPNLKYQERKRLAAEKAEREAKVKEVPVIITENDILPLVWETNQLVKKILEKVE